jgi:IclR family transcriptional regulator, KDG regulon repressor
MGRMVGDSGGVLDSTLLKGLKVLRYLVDSPTPTSVSALAAHLDLPKSNVHRTLSTLVGAGYACRNDNALYQPTLLVWELGMQVMNRNLVRRAAVAFMHTLQQETTETVNLVVPDGDDCIYIHQVEASSPLRISSTVGERAPAVLTVSGRVMLAHDPDAEQRARQLYARQVSPAPPFRLDGLLSELANTRRDGYAMSASVWRPGINSLAGVISGADGHPVGAIAVAGPKERFTQEKMQAITQSLLSTCANISRALGA